MYINSNNYLGDGGFLGARYSCLALYFLFNNFIYNFYSFGSGFA